MNNYYGNTFSYDKLKRLAAGIVALVLWGLSIKFSVGGFGAGISPDELWIGWLLGFCITIIQLVWNGIKGKTNLTLYVLGLSAYAYGIYTNVYGIMLWRGDSLDTLVASPLTILFPLILGLFLEIAPEPLFVWAFTTRLDEGDFLGNLLSNTQPNTNNHKPSHRNSMPSQNPPPGINRFPQQYNPIVNGRNQAGKGKNNNHPQIRREE